MNHDFLIKNTNRIAVYATVALIYWVFVFLIVTVFDLKIFREKMTDMFFLSLLGIFAILGGAIVLNVMSNLSKISAAVSAGQEGVAETAKPMKLRMALIALTFPLIAVVLMAGNYQSVQRKKDMLVNSAQKLVAENQPALELLSNYKFSLDYINKSAGKLEVIRKIDKNFPEVMVIVPDMIDDKKLFLAFNGNRHYVENEKLEKLSYIFSATKDERAYLDKVFAGDEEGIRFNADKGSYQLYFPVSVAGRKIVLYFSDYQRYGKYGS